jgi:hypothetical protein
LQTVSCLIFHCRWKRIQGGCQRSVVLRVEATGSGAGQWPAESLHVSNNWPGF